MRTQTSDGEPEGGKYQSGYAGGDEHWRAESENDQNEYARTSNLEGEDAWRTWTDN